MSVLVFKQRCFHPNHPKTAVSNREHLRYIATRTGVVCNSGMGHGLFGKAFGMAVCGDIENLDEFKSYIHSISKEKTIVYRTVISLREADAIQKGYDKRSAWEQLIQSKIGTIAEKMRIPIDRLEYCAAVHMDKGHPHVHLLYWEREQGVRKAWIHPAVSNAIRRNLNKYVFAEEFEQLYQNKNNARKGVEICSGEILTESVYPLYGMDSEEYKKILAELQAIDPDLCPGSLPYGKIPQSRYTAILADILRLRDDLPTAGRLSYKLMPPEIKQRLDAITLSILASNTDCKREFDSYVHTAMEIAEMNTSDSTVIDAAGRKAYGELLNKIGNKILQSTKDLSALESDLDRQERQEQYRRQAMDTLLKEVFSVLSQSTEQQQAQVFTGKTGELSKQAKKELAIKLQDRTTNWER